MSNVTPPEPQVSSRRHTGWEWNLLFLRAVLETLPWSGTWFSFRAAFGSFKFVALVKYILGDQGAVSGWRQSQWGKNRFKKRLKRGKVGMNYFAISPLTGPGSPRMLADHWCRLIQTYSHRKHNCCRFLPNSAENKPGKLRAVYVLLCTEKIPASRLIFTTRYSV